MIKVELFAALSMIKLWTTMRSGIQALTPLSPIALLFLPRGLVPPVPQAVMTHACNYTPAPAAIMTIPFFHMPKVHTTTIAPPSSRASEDEMKLTPS
jgi:hypothetical protein